MEQIGGLLFPLLILVVFWFFIIRPQTKRQKEQKQFSEGLKKGDKVITASGIIGTISKVDSNIVQLQIGQKVFIQVTRGSISKEMTALLPKIDSGEVVDTNVQK